MLNNRCSSTIVVVEKQCVRGVLLLWKVKIFFRSV